MFEALWDMSEADMSSVYGTYTAGLQQAAAVVVGGGVRAVVSSLATVVGEREIQIVPNFYQPEA
eukprot:5330-Heterococcus_DN1.PRE.2